MGTIKATHREVVLDALASARDQTWYATYRIDESVDKKLITEAIQNAQDILLWISAGFKMGTL